MGPFGYRSFLYRASSCQSLSLKLINKETTSQFSFIPAPRATNAQPGLGGNPEQSAWFAGHSLSWVET